MKKHNDNRGAERLRELFPREKGGQSAVTKATKVAQGVVSRWFSGDRKPDPTQRAKLEDLYGIGWRMWDLEFERGSSTVSS